LVFSALPVLIYMHLFFGNVLLFLTNPTTNGDLKTFETYINNKNIFMRELFRK
jgi:hypothetical protein